MQTQSHSGVFRPFALFVQGNASSAVVPQVITPNPRKYVTRAEIEMLLATILHDKCQS